MPLCWSQAASENRTHALVTLEASVHPLVADRKSLTASEQLGSLFAYTFRKCCRMNSLKMEGGKMKCLLLLDCGSHSKFLSGNHDESYFFRPHIFSAIKEKWVNCDWLRVSNPFFLMEYHINMADDVQNIYFFCSVIFTADKLHWRLKLQIVAKALCSFSL